MLITLKIAKVMNKKTCRNSIKGFWPQRRDKGPTKSCPNLNLFSRNQTIMSKKITLNFKSPTNFYMVNNTKKPSSQVKTKVMSSTIYKKNLSNFKTTNQDTMTQVRKINSSTLFNN